MCESYGGAMSESESSCIIDTIAIVSSNVSNCYIVVTLFIAKTHS